MQDAIRVTVTVVGPFTRDIVLRIDELPPAPLPVAASRAAADTTARLRGRPAL